jgi:hypothetical protein
VTFFIAPSNAKSLTAFELLHCPEIAIIGPELAMLLAINA